MTVATTFTRAPIGVKAPLVTVETHKAAGLPHILIVGLPETAVKESKDRVRAAIVNSGFKVPGNKFTVNLAPADLPKQGGRYDLAIALSIIGATAQENIDLESLGRLELLGELALDGTLREVNGVLPAALANRESNRMLVVPPGNGPEAALAGSDNVRIAHSLHDVVGYLKGERTLETPTPVHPPSCSTGALISDIRGQHLAKHALVIAAAGAHNLLMVGPPGAGKTMLASRLPTLLPALSEGQSLEVASIQSVSRYGFKIDTWGRRPFRNPHHTASAVALVGGGRPPTPGEISLAHHGVLFLDELPEYKRSVLEVLREPMESGRIVISRASYQIDFPSRFQLIAAMNPCPCGYHGDAVNPCTCGIDQIEKYRNRVSGPLMDRIDLHVEVPALPKGALSDPSYKSPPSSHQDAVDDVARAQGLMYARAGKLNAYLSGKEVERFCRLCKKDQETLDDAMNRLGLSARGYYKVLKVARTIADLSGCIDIETSHLMEALGYRHLDRQRATAQ